MSVPGNKVDGRFENWVSVVLDSCEGFRERCIAWDCLKRHCKSQLSDERLAQADQLLVATLTAAANDEEENLGERVAALCLLRGDFQRMLSEGTLTELETMLFDRCLTAAEDVNLVHEERTVALGFIERCFQSRKEEPRVAAVRSSIKKSRRPVEVVHVKADN
jgi:hypothetical protein